MKNLRACISCVLMACLIASAMAENKPFTLRPDVLAYLQSLPQSPISQQLPLLAGAFQEMLTMNVKNPDEVRAVSFHLSNATACMGLDSAKAVGASAASDEYKKFILISVVELGTKVANTPALEAKVEAAYRAIANTPEAKRSEAEKMVEALKYGHCL